MSDVTRLNDKQNEAYSRMAKGESIFLTGPAGTGKTSVIKIFTRNYSEQKTIAVTSSTGTSALLMNGTTLHSYTGIGLGKGSVESLVENIRKRAYLGKRWRNLQVLIIDEISMISPELFDKLENIARIIRNNTSPFGGIQLILSGDFCQLPCVGEEKFCFEAEKWKECITHTVYLDQIIRQSDPEFQECLNTIRLGKIPDNVETILKSRLRKNITNKHGIAPTKLFSLNYAVDRVNEKELDKLAQDGREFFEYNMEIVPCGGCKNAYEAKNKFRRNCTAQETLQLCIGAQVMLLYNMDLENKLANGSRGIVTSFSNELPVVKFLNGNEHIIGYHIWEFNENNIKILKATQIPLKLAYAISIHKSQGCSLDCVEIDLGEIFEYGQAYAALSRAKTLQGVSITSLDIDCIMAHPKAVEYYNKLMEG
jgi:ATP-dependent DNA helicase PIF1